MKLTYNVSKLNNRPISIVLTEVYGFGYKLNSLSPFVAKRFSICEENVQATLSLQFITVKNDACDFPKTLCNILWNYVAKNNIIHLA